MGLKSNFLDIPVFQKIVNGLRLLDFLIHFIITIMAIIITIAIFCAQECGLRDGCSPKQSHKM